MQLDTKYLGVYDVNVTFDGLEEANFFVNQSYQHLVSFGFPEIGESLNLVLLLYTQGIYLTYHISFCEDLFLRNRADTVLNKSQKSNAPKMNVNFSRKSHHTLKRQGFKYRKGFFNANDKLCKIHEKFLLAKICTLNVIIIRFACVAQTLYNSKPQ